jgi:hypothetical protein
LPNPPTLAGKSSPRDRQVPIDGYTVHDGVIDEPKETTNTDSPIAELNTLCHRDLCASSCTVPSYR